MKVAITGVSGVIGTTIHDHLKNSGLQIVGIDQPVPATQAPEEHRPHTEFVDITCDLSDPLDKLMARNPFAECDAVIHLAADARAEAKFMEDILPRNIVALYNVCELAKAAKVKRVVFASSLHSQFGSYMGGDTEILDESKLPNGYGSVTLNEFPVPSSLYGVSKLFGENMGCYYSKVLNAFEFLSLRIAFILYDDPNAYKGKPTDSFLRSMWLSKRDCCKIFEATVKCELKDKYAMAYAVSNNSKRIFDIDSSVKLLGYRPQDNAEDYATD